ncbi:MAG: T9SS type A sorting domain-containing protein [Aureispira sp.]
MKLFCIALVVLIISGVPSMAQPYLLTFGDFQIGEKGVVSHLMPDGSFWVFGVIEAGPLGSNDVLFTRRDIQGNIINAERYLGGPNLDYPNNLLVQNGEMIVAGEVIGVAGGNGAIWVLDTSGRLVSSNQYGLAGQSEQFYDIKATADGGFVVTGFGNQPNGNANDVLVSKFDQNKQQEWLQTYDFGTNEVGVSIIERPTGGYFVAADQLQPSGNYNVLLLALDSVGNALWDSVITSPYNGGCKQMKRYQDQIVIVGEMATSTSTAFDPYMIRLNLAGQVQWKGTIPQSNNGDAIFDLAIKDANTYFLTGYGYNTATANTDVILLTVDSVGQIRDRRYYGGNSFDMAYDIQLLSTHEVVLTGFSTIQNNNQLLVVQDDLSSVLSMTNSADFTTPSFSIAPNPTWGWVQIADLPLDESYKVVVYNRIGQVVWEGELPSNHQVNLTHLQEGYYYVQIQGTTTIGGSVLYKY